MRVLIADKLEETAVAGIRELGCGVKIDPELQEESLAAAIREHDPDVLIVRSTEVRKPAIDAAGRLSLIIRAGAGYDTIDVGAASDRSVFVANCPGTNSLAVVELAWGLIIACDRRIPDQAQELREGRFNKKEYSARAKGLCGRTLGIIGVGRIGEEMISRGRAFGMKVICYSPSLTVEKAERLGVERCQTPNEVARRADVISIHCAANESTRHLVNGSFCEAMRPDAILVNCSRSTIIDEAAITKAVHTKRIRVGLDVFEGEPAAKVGECTNPLFRLPGVYGTHHVGASTDQAQQAVAAEVVRIIREYKTKGTVLHCVNRQEKSRATAMVSVAHHNQPGVLAAVLHVIGEANINIEEMQNTIYRGAQTASARIWLSTQPDDAIVERIRTCHKHIVSVDLHEISESESARLEPAHA